MSCLLLKGIYLINTKNCILLLIITTSILLCNNGNAYSYDLAYNIRITKTNAYVHVKIDVNNIKAGIERIAIDLPELNESFDINDFIINEIAYDPNGTLEINKENKYFWIIDDVYQNLNIEYDIEKKLYRNDGFLLGEIKRALSYFNSEYGFFWSKFLFLTPIPYDYIYYPPSEYEVDSIHINFDVPEDWTVMSPFKKEKDYYKVESDKVIDIVKHFKESAFYMGKVDLYAEKLVNGTRQIMAKMVGDDNEFELLSQKELEYYLKKTGQVYDEIISIFNDNPYPVCLWMPNFHQYENGKQIGLGFSFTGNGWHYWPKRREFEITCHLIQSWMSSSTRGPFWVETGIEKGIGEYYLGYVLASEIFNDPVDLGKMYYTYLVYDRMHGCDLYAHYEQDFMKGYNIGILMDNILKMETKNEYGIREILSILYDEYALTYHTVTYEDLEYEINKLDGVDLRWLFDRYIYGDDKIPSYQYLAKNKKHFEKMSYVLEDTFYMRLYGQTIPLFICIEMLLHLDHHIMAGMVNNNYLEEFADYAISHYSVDDLTEADVEDILASLTGDDCSGFFSQWNSSYGDLSLNQLKIWLKSYKNDSEGDGLVDSWEKAYFDDIHVISGGGSDYDSDGLTNAGEYQFNTDPTDPDSDDDGYSDWEEVQAGTDPKKFTHCLPDIKANSSNREVTVFSPNPVSVTTSLDPGKKEGHKADWWILADTDIVSPSGWFSYVYPTGWKSGVHRCIQYPIIELPEIELLKAVLPEGDYTFYFGIVVDNEGGTPDGICLDTVDVIVK